MGIIDRFEGDFAVVETPDRKHESLPRKLLPMDAKEGDAICIKNGIYVIDSEKTRQLRCESVRLQDELFK